MIEKTTANKVITAARELGKAIQADERYIAYVTTKAANDKDEELQNLIGEFNLTRQNLQMQAMNPKRDQDKINELNALVQDTYAKVMGNERMAAFTIAKADMDELTKEVTGIINMCCEGADPDTAVYIPGGCGGDCGGCSGCG